MKYWLFERGDVVGPFPAEELTGREGFGPQSLVCPEDRGDDDTFWKEAQFYEDFAPAASPAPAEPDEKQASAVPEPAQPAEKKDVFDEELDSLLSENNPLAEAEPSAGETAEKVHFPPHEPAKSGPIEDYFNNIQGGDLGNILGIPDPNENSDMNLARALEKQFKQTEPPLQAQTPVQIESGPFDEFTAKEDLDDLTPGDGLAAVAPLNDNGAPVVLAEKPLPAEEKPKFRLRKKQEPKPGEDKTALRAETQPVPEKEPATEKNLQSAQAVPTPAAVPGEKQTPAEQEPAGHIPADKKSAPEKASAEEPQPQAQKEETLTEEKQPAETQAPAEKAEEISPAGAADGETVLPEETQPQTQGAVSPAEQAEPAPAPQTETTGAADSAPLQAAQEVQPEPAPQAEPETEEMDSIPLSVAREPLALSVKNPDGLKETPAEETPAPANGPAETAEPEAQTRSPQEKPILDIQETAEEQTSQTAQEPEGNAPQSAPEPEKETSQAAQVPAGEQTPAPAAQDPVEEIMSGAVEVNTAPEVPEPIKQVAPVVEPQVNRVKPKLKKTPEIEQFLTEKILPADEPPARRNKGVLWAGVLLVLLLLAGGFLLLLKPAATKPETAPAAQPLTQSGGAVEELMPDAAVQPEVPTAQEALSLPAAPSAKAKSAAPAAPAAPELNPVDTARQIVQNYNLPNFNGKVSDYFDRIYKDKLAQGYSATWSAERLHNNVYIVKYRLSKTRSEPVVYIFQVDVARNKLTGALNNITLDLVGKIK